METRLLARPCGWPRRSFGRHGHAKPTCIELRPEPEEALAIRSIEEIYRPVVKEPLLGCLHVEEIGIDESFTPPSRTTALEHHGSNPTCTYFPQVTVPYGLFVSKAWRSRDLRQGLGWLTERLHVYVLLANSRR